MSCGFNGSLPPEIGDLSKLEYLNISENSLTGSIPKEIANCSSLINLDLRYNQLTGSIPPELGDAPNLESLGAAYNQLSGDIPDEIWEIPSLDLRYNYLTGTFNETQCAKAYVYGNLFCTAMPIGLLGTYCEGEPKNHRLQNPGDCD